MITQHWCRLWLGAIRQQAITWANVDPDLCHHMASLGLNELSWWEKTLLHTYIHIQPSFGQWEKMFHLWCLLSLAETLLKQRQKQAHIDGLVQDCSNSTANALELLQSCTKPSIWWNRSLNALLHYKLVTPKPCKNHHHKTIDFLIYNSQMKLLYLAYSKIYTNKTNAKKIYHGISRSGVTF